MDETPVPIKEAVAEVLQAAGYPRAVSFPPGAARDGYAVLANRPGDGIVIVNWWETGEDADLPRHARMLAAYEAEITAAGYAVRGAGDLADPGEPTHPEYLIVTSKEGRT